MSRCQRSANAVKAQCERRESALAHNVRAVRAHRTPYERDRMSQELCSNALVAVRTS